MPFPRINYCLVCENFRQEILGKLSILGFMGITPNVDVGIGRLDQPFAVVFIIGFGIVEDANQAYSYTGVILNPDGSTLFQNPQPVPINTMAGRGGIIIFPVMGIPRVVGLRTIRLIINGQMCFESQFMIHQATPVELAGIPGARPQ